MGIESLHEYSGHIIILCAMNVQRPSQHSGILSHNGNQHKAKLLVTHAMGRIFTFSHLYNFEKVLAQFLSTERVCKR